MYSSDFSMLVLLNCYLNIFIGLGAMNMMHFVLKVTPVHALASSQAQHNIAWA